MALKRVWSEPELVSVSSSKQAIQDEGVDAGSTFSAPFLKQEK